MEIGELRGRREEGERKREKGERNECHVRMSCEGWSKEHMSKSPVV